MPAAFPAMAAIASDSALSPVLTMNEQLSLVLAMLLGFGIVFEVPVVIAFLSMIGRRPLDHALEVPAHRHHRERDGLAAIITPTGDPLNLAMMAVPMILFYEIGIILARILGKKRPEEAAAAATR